jgi:hypothetical protein
MSPEYPCNSEQGMYDNAHDEEKNIGEQESVKLFLLTEFVDLLIG